MAAFDAGASLDQRIRAHASLGRVLVQLDAPRGRVEAQYGLVRALWKDPAAAARAVAAGGAGDRGLGVALTAVGEALFYFAEQKRREVEEIHFPEHRGEGDRDEIRQHVETKIVPWMAHKRIAIDAAEREYLEVVKLQPVPPPRWVIASASRVGQMWGKLRADLRAVPMPREWAGHGHADIRQAYLSAIDDLSEPIEQRAMAAFRTCLAYATKYQYADEYSRLCIDWLSKNDKAHVSAIEELMPRLGGVGAPAPAGAPVADSR